MTDFTKAIASTDQPMATFKALEELVDKTIGVKLFTLMEVDNVRGVARRNYSNMPDAYATSGEKPIQDNSWTEQVQGRHETFVANSIEEIAAVFPDHELIQSLGCESCMNLPIVVNERVIGTLNCLHDAGHFTPERVGAAESLKQAGALAFLLEAYLKKEAN
ncbi:MAG: GAF domain-containing protein [Paracoccaceae bacterium]|jgi:transcriptional regulator with GAF, ATPase, and Fis domain|nr:GAF domain-containing protein [Paracoccaceae bacterium]MDG1739745.1 GAF domain-containing protein [Paracoccaceae bacterium]MDG2256896.1 GAF domain-containing protein [Paracoccaceae bacterium]|tara:strand:- start:320 stop:805 length:486 start_codon:yes stop_codon:yes gene_type:complete